MSTKIEWTHRPGTKPEVWNVVTGCNKVSQGCKNCYAEPMHKRLQKMLPEKYGKPFLEGVVLHEDALQLPYKWKKPRTVFVNSMSDLFHHDISLEFLNKVFIVMLENPQHTFIILTKRPLRAEIYFNCELNRNVSATPLPNVWLGVSVENQETANERIPYLNFIPAAVKFLSCEPLLGPIDFEKAIGESLKWHCGGLAACISWVIVGGESGHNARPMHPEWVKNIKDQCKTASVPFFFKQWGEWMPDRLFHSLEEIQDNTCIKARAIQLIKINGLHYDRIFLDVITEPLFRMLKVGKKKAGNVLDGKQYLEFPKVETNA